MIKLIFSSKVEAHVVDQDVITICECFEMQPSYFANFHLVIFSNVQQFYSLFRLDNFI